MKKTKPMIRINTRIRPDQSKYIKSQAKQLKVTEGDVLRGVIDYAIDAITPKKLSK
jgi:hypothetical protein